MQRTARKIRKADALSKIQPYLYEKGTLLCENEPIDIVSWEELEVLQDISHVDDILEIIY